MANVHGARTRTTQIVALLSGEAGWKTRGFIRFPGVFTAAKALNWTLKMDPNSPLKDPA